MEKQRKINLGLFEKERRINNYKLPSLVNKKRNNRNSLSYEKQSEKSNLRHSSGVYNNNLSNDDININNNAEIGEENVLYTPTSAWERNERKEAKEISRSLVGINKRYIDFNGKKVDLGYLTRFLFFS
jgi:hypothetical protein